MPDLLNARTLIAACCTGLFTLAATAAETPNALGLAPSLNLLTFADFASSYSDVQGRVAVGGNMTISGYSINTKNGSTPLYGGAGLTVGGNLQFNGGTVAGPALIGGSLSTNSGATFKSSVDVGGNLNANNAWLTAGSLQYGGTASNIVAYQNPAPVKAAAGTSVSLGIDFAAEKTRLTSLSKQLDGLADSGSSSNPWGSTVYLNGNGASQAVFDLSASDVSKNLELTNLAAGATVLINVHGSFVDFTNHGYTNFASGQVLFNLPEATQVSFSGGTFASFLAPLASFNTSYGVINGQVIANSWTGSVQVNDASFRGVLSAVPEPKTYAMMLAGLAAMGWLAKRRAKTPATHKA